MKGHRVKRDYEWFEIELPGRKGERPAVFGSRPFARHVGGRRNEFPSRSAAAARDWWVDAIARKGRLLAEYEWTAERLRYAMLELRECVEIDPAKRSGVPVVRGTRYTVAEMLAELAEGKTISDIARRRRVDEDKMKRVLESFAICLDRSAFE